ncbi:hypothetical protein DFA_03311 [Cavenderia fasciculata]|uniref:Ankyrin repeat-containing protein n=1 Tax=Cavenderia fasciculata TaxID=261658 RepID=F4PH81_CACFS|nr:uncharacterized protein DFA_03311 [Cavenderia fasciculata]EGG25065.1 hypothetical protein DFA_03311 [Cavenderia fasciculata]|eukprot:XP_004362916.1 hypothetical protein DFA_03311 [Cavenderia fasciculata]
MSSLSQSSTIISSVFKSSVLLRYILSLVEEIHERLEEKKPCKFKDMTSKNVSFHRYSNNGLLFQAKLECDPNFIAYYRAMPIILNNCTNVLVLQRLHTLYSHYFGHAFREIVSRHGKDVYIGKTLGKCANSPSWVVDNIAASGSIPCLVYGIETIGIQPTENTIDMACEHGKLGILHFLHENYPQLQCTDRAFELAANNSHLDIIEFLLYNRTEKYTARALVNASRTKCVDVARLLLEMRGERLVGHTEEQLIERNLVDLSVTSGSLEMVQLYFKHFGRRGLTTRALDNSAELGFLDIVLWLDQTAGAPATTDAMNFAAKNGHYSIIRFLHENRVEGCTESAINKAAAGGFLDIVQFLHVNRTEGATKDAMHNAVASGSLEVVKFLHKNRTELCNGANTVATACQNGTGDYAESIKYILENRITPFTKKSPLNNLESSDFTQIMMWTCLRDNLDLYIFLVDFFHLGVGIEPNVASHPFWKHFESAASVTFKMWIIEQFDPKSLDIDRFTHFITYSNIKGGERVLQYVMDHCPRAFQRNWSFYLQRTVYDQNIKVLQFFHDHAIPNSFTQQMFNYAGEVGALKVVKFLHLNRTEGCTTLAMDSSGKSGYLEVCQWIYANRTEGSTKSIIKSVISSQRYEVLQFLVNNNIHTEAEDLVDCASASRSVEILEYIVEMFPNLLPTVYSFSHHDELILRFLVHHFPTSHIRSLKYMPTQNQVIIDQLCKDKDAGVLKLYPASGLHVSHQQKDSSTTSPPQQSSIFKKLFFK